jgi:hypothetical protein
MGVKAKDLETTIATNMLIRGDKYRHTRSTGVDPEPQQIALF